MDSNKRTLVFDDVSNHNKTDDCWLIISGKVYDVTLFMDDHPGGSEVMWLATGKDATVDFNDVGHSDEAIEMLDKYYLGEIDQSTIPTKRSFFQSPQFIVKVLLFVASFMILSLAFMSELT